jgi:hypothetical protein
MTLHVTCDVCRRRYQVDEARLGTTLTCKECSVPFDVCRQNFVDPDEPEPNPDEAEQDAPTSEWSQVWACTVNGVGATGVILALIGMVVLLYRDPREVAGPKAAVAATMVPQGRTTAPATSRRPPRVRDHSDDTTSGFSAPRRVEPAAGPASVGMPEAFLDPENTSSQQVPATELAVVPVTSTVSAEHAEPLPPLALSAIDPPRVQPERTFRVLGTGLSRVERVVLVPTNAPAVAARWLSGFEVVSDEELRVQIGRRASAYVLVLERADVTLVTVPADAHIVTTETQPPRSEAPGCVVVRDGGRYEADGVVCCFVERGGELHCPSTPNWAGWFAEGSLATGRLLPPSAWITPETVVRTTVPVRASFAVTTPRIVAAEVDALVVADPSAEETAEFTGTAPRRRSSRDTPAARLAGARIGGINYDGPGSIPSSGRRIDATTPLEVGQIVQVQEHRQWYPGDVLRVNDDGTVRVHYRGWPNARDADVPRSRIQLAHEN